MIKVTFIPLISVAHDLTCLASRLGCVLDRPVLRADTQVDTGRYNRLSIVDDLSGINFLERIRRICHLNFTPPLPTFQFGNRL